MLALFGEVDRVWLGILRVCWAFEIMHMLAFGEVGSQLKGSTGLAAVSVFCFFDWVGCLFVLTVARRKVRLVVRSLLPYCCRWVRFTFRFAFIRICVTHNCSENTCSFFSFFNWLHQIRFEINSYLILNTILIKWGKFEKKFSFSDFSTGFQIFFSFKFPQSFFRAKPNRRRSAPRLSMRNLFANFL